MLFSLPSFLRSSRLGAAAALFAAAALAGNQAAVATEADAILKALVRKGVLSTNDAAAIQDEAHHEEQQTSANKLKLSDSLTELRLYGDIRLRYQHDNRDFQLDPARPSGSNDRSPSGNQQDRLRLRLRLNADFKLKGGWFGGVQLQTGFGSDTGNQTLENGFSNYSIFINRAYLGYSPNDWLTFTGGKVPNPFYTTELVWDPDISPSGFTQQIAFHKLFGHGESSSSGLSKDGKTMAPAGETPWELTLVAGQFIFDDNVEGGGGEPGRVDTDTNSDPWLFETQLIAAYRFSPNLKITFAPAWMVYTAGTVSVPASVTTTFGTINSSPFVDSADVSGATRHLNILNGPGDIAMKFGNLPVKLYWDVAYNIEGRSRANDVYRLFDTSSGRPRAEHRTRDDFAWLAGVQVGENKKKGNLSLIANYREVGITAIDPNLNDSEFALGQLNVRGFRVGLNYNLTDAAVFSLNYYGAWSLDRNLVGGEATGGNAIANSNAVQVLQVDLNVKF